MAPLSAGQLRTIVFMHLSHEREASLLASSVEDDTAVSDCNRRVEKKIDDSYATNFSCSKSIIIRIVH